jgi:hypothetical protein
LDEHIAHTKVLVRGNAVKKMAAPISLAGFQLDQMRVVSDFLLLARS